jgi:hypothetical protein
MLPEFEDQKLNAHTAREGRQRYSMLRNKVYLIHSTPQQQPRMTQKPYPAIGAGCAYAYACLLKGTANRRMCLMQSIERAERLGAVFSWKG